MNFNGKIIVKSDTIFLNFDKNSQLFLLASFNFSGFLLYFLLVLKKKAIKTCWRTDIFCWLKFKNFQKCALKKKTAIGVPTTPTTGIPYPPPPGKYGMLRPPFEKQNICLKCRVDRKIRTKHPLSSSTTFGPTFIRGRGVFKA